MEPNKFPADLLQKYLDGTITEPESETLFAWLKENPAAVETDMEAVLRGNYDAAFENPIPLTAGGSQRILDRLMVSMAAEEEPVEHRLPLWRRTWVRYAAAAIITGVVAATGAQWLHSRKQTQVAPPVVIASGTNRAVLKLSNGQEIMLDSTRGSIVQEPGLTVRNDSGRLNYQGATAAVEYHTLTTPRGGQYRIQLPDGTAVWLNAASSITYPTAFTEKVRAVIITGEAYFEVAANTRQPFRVDVNGKATVEVLGTRFNVNAYTDENSIRTTLVDGSVRVNHKQASVVLKPGQQAAISETGLQLLEHPDLDMAMAWKNGSFQFDHAHLKEVLRQMARWYDVTVVYEPGSADIIFSGEIKRDLDLSQALIVLERMGVRYRIEGKQLIIMP
ncbi:FecR family protein [Chitinophaga qingshengii]|uniref:FecR domain-containing protein n=1 Tax=Chitinophaga qingshengii TaxID=1569794 RepID=A0ABR7TS68_9BACT|nr:FecR family protein [Chitinophaga qingshengii]MBC9932865.1 FecR domain-containing protein [Chitinophaga qingshengii]